MDLMQTASTATFPEEDRLESEDRTEPVQTVLVPTVRFFWFLGSFASHGSDDLAAFL
jgi:hypothetical protein